MKIRRLRFIDKPLPFQDKDFKEDDHPRDPDGKFTSGGGKSIQGGVTIPKEGSLSNKIWAMAHNLSKKNGKSPTASELSAYAASKGMELNKATVGTQLNYYKKWAAANPAEAEEPKKEKPKLPNTLESVATLSEAAGLKKEGEFGGVTYFKNDNTKVSYKPDTKSWQVKTDGELVAQGNGDMADLEAALAKIPKVKKPKTSQTQPAPKIDQLATHTAPNYASALPKSSFSYNSHGIPKTEGFPSGIQSALKRYTGSRYKQINAAMRFEADYDSLDTSTMRDILHLQKAFHCVPETTKEASVGRKVGLDALKTMAKHAGLNHLTEIQPGTILQEDGISSTSHSENIWSGDVRFSIKIPKGAKAIYVDDISPHKGENETLLPPGTKFKINKVQQDTGWYKFDIECEVLL